MAHTVDLNADLGEGSGHDGELMPLVSSANIACGAHAGDMKTLRETIRLAIHHGVSIGAHPGFADPANFGRMEIPIAPDAAASLVLEQVKLARKAASLEGARVRHVKLHGALYNMAARDRSLSDAIAAAVHSTDPALILVGLAGSQTLAAGRAAGLRVASEAFADRTYQPDGSLTPRSRPNAVIRDPESAASQALRMILEGKVRATDGTDLPILADTLCLHGDTPDAVSFARTLRASLHSRNIALKAL